MSVQAPDTQAESRTKTAGIPVTPSEKAALEGLARLRGVPESELLRSMLLSDIVAEFRRAQSLLEPTEVPA